MEKFLDELIETVKNETCYSEFKKAEKKLSEENLLLAEYRRVLDEYQEMKKYAKHIDISETRERLKNVQEKMNQSDVIQAYYTHYHQLNNFLTELTSLIFKDISDELSMSPYKIK